MVILFPTSYLALESHLFFHSNWHFHGLSQERLLPRAAQWPPPALSFVALQFIP